jgi:hypothetical protein
MIKNRRHKKEFGMDSLPSEHGDHMIMLSITKKKKERVINID